MLRNSLKHYLGTYDKYVSEPTFLAFSFKPNKYEGNTYQTPFGDLSPCGEQQVTRPGPLLPFNSLFLGI
ncbi:hypothetical protein AtNW77_Chr5g0131961 [Arabidopsis thaliana]